MAHRLRTASLHLLAVGGILLLATTAGAIGFTPFLPGGAGGRVNGQTFTIGAGGEVEELDAFLGIGGLDLNGAAAGVTTPLGGGGLPSGLAFTFGASLSTDATDLTLEYSFANGTGGDLDDVTFLPFVDAEIDERVNSFFNEYAEVLGTPATGQGFEVDEPGFVFGDVYDHLQAGALDGVNAVPAGAPEDVSLALSFAIDRLANGETFAISILISEDGDRLGPLALAQLDADSEGTQIWVSGEASVTGGPEPAIPEPTGALVFALGALLVMARRRA